MKRIILSFAVLAMTFGATAQSITDNFDTYTAGQYLAEQNSLVWTTWSGAPGTSEDAYVSDVMSVSGANSVVFEDGSTDLVLPLGDLTSGAYELSMEMYFPAGNGGYFNLLHNFAPNEWEWAIDCFFNGDGTGSSIAAGEEITYTYAQDTWINVTVVIDLDNDNGILLIDGVEARNWQWSLDGSTGDAGMNKLAALDVYPAAIMGALFYVDDVTFGVHTSIDAPEGSVEFTIAPNPATENATVYLSANHDQSVLTLFDLTGKVVYNENVSGANSTVVDLSGLSNGVYLMQVTSGNERQTKRLVVNK